MSDVPAEVRAQVLLEHAELFLIAAAINAGTPPALAVHTTTTTQFQGVHV